MDRVETYHEIAELISLTITVPTVVFSIIVVYIWSPSTFEALGKKSIHKTEVDWFIIGVCIGFAGGIMDNIYWAFAWSADYLGLASKDRWFQNGVYSNIPFRQVAGSLAAICHIKAAMVTRSQLFKTICTATVTATVAGLLILLYARHLS
jgi:hypothetical protein